MIEVLTAQNGQLATALDTDNLIAEWLEYEATANGTSQNTINTYRRSIGIFCSAIKTGLEYVKPGDVVEFKAIMSERYSAQTVNLHLAAVRSFYRYCVNQNYTVLNPASEVKGVKRSKSKTHKRDALANGEVAQVLKQPATDTLAGLRDKVILILLSYCALRAIEVHRANINDLRTRGDRLTLDIQGKRRAEKDEYVIIPLSQEPVIREYTKRLGIADSNAPLFFSLSNRTRGKRLTLRSIRYLVKKYFGEAGVIGDKKTTHSLRHSAITNAIRRGATPLQVQAMARHQSFDTTLNYIHEVGRIDNPAEDVISYE